MNTEPSPQGKYGVRFPRASGHTFVNQSIRNFVLHVFLFKVILFNIYCWFINIELMANSTICHAWTKLMYCKARHTRQHFNSIHGAILNSEVRHQTGHKCDTKQMAEMILVYSMRAETKGEHCLVWFYLGTACQMTKIFMPWALLQMTKSSASIGCGVQINVSTQANVQMWNQLIMRINCTKNAGWKMLIRSQWNSYSTSKNIPWK